eukprot:Colp12_sorted_trinity150504_noHs@33364
MATRKTLAVFGGNGMLGSAIAAHAVRMQFNVKSFSRSGWPPSALSWTQKVQWVAADALKPEQYEKHLAECDAVVHCVGALLEDTSLSRALKPGNNSNAPKIVNYEEINRDTALRVAEAAVKTGKVQTFAFISAATLPPFVDPRYLTTKREAEEALLAMDQLNTLIFRPGFMYTRESLPLSALATTLAATRGLAACLGATAVTSRVEAPLAVETVARAVVRALGGAGGVPHKSAIYPVSLIEALASR